MLVYFLCLVITYVCHGDIVIFNMTDTFDI